MHLEQADRTIFFYTISFLTRLLNARAEPRETGSGRKRRASNVVVPPGREDAGRRRRRPAGFGTRGRGGLAFGT